MSKAHPFQGGKWFQKQIDQRVRASLVLLEKQFPVKHHSDMDTQLLEYLRECACELGHTPNSREVIGGTYIAARFGDWLIAVRKAGLPMPKKAPSLTQCMIYKQEFQRQGKLFQAQQQTKRENRTNAKAARTLEQTQEKEKRAVSEAAWKAGHHSKTDQQLLDYIRQCAIDLGHVPVKKEVLGSELIRERFGSWAAALVLADLQLPQGMKPPSNKDVAQARQRLSAVSTAEISTERE